MHLYNVIKCEFFFFLAIFHCYNFATFHMNNNRVLKDHEKWWSTVFSEEVYLRILKNVCCNFSKVNCQFLLREKKRRILWSAYKIFLSWSSYNIFFKILRYASSENTVPDQDPWTNWWPLWARIKLEGRSKDLYLQYDWQNLEEEYCYT